METPLWSLKCAIKKELASPQGTSAKSSSSGISSTPTKNTAKITFLANNNASIVKYAEKKGVDRKKLEEKSLEFQSKILELMEELTPVAKRQREKAESSTVTDIIESVATGSTIGEGSKYKHCNCDLVCFFCSEEQ